MRTRHRWWVGLIVVSLFPWPLSAGVSSARKFLLQGQIGRAVSEYSRLRLMRRPALAAEYAYVLALAGMKDLALLHLDKALALTGDSADALGVIHYYAGEVFALIGRPDLSVELARQAAPRPSWIPAGFTPKEVIPEGLFPVEIKIRQNFGLENQLAMANTLMLQKRFYSAADRFQDIVTKYPSDAMAHAGFAIALEKIGAFRMSARAVARSMDLRGPRMTPDQRAVYEAHGKELELRPQGPPVVRRPQESLKGRYLAFLGGYVNRNKTTTVSNVNGRLGKFFTNRLDAGVTAGYTGGNLPNDFRGFSAGLSSRYHQPVPMDLPINVTLGLRMDYNPRPSNKMSVVISPGLSWVVENGSLDLYVDRGLSGPLKKTNTLSLGYTTYFGGTK